jgi:hypothetical protein
MPSVSLMAILTPKSDQTEEASQTVLSFLSCLTEPSLGCLKALLELYDSGETLDFRRRTMRERYAKLPGEH